MRLLIQGRLGLLHIRRAATIDSRVGSNWRVPRWRDTVSCWAPWRRGSRELATPRALPDGRRGACERRLARRAWTGGVRLVCGAVGHQGALQQRISVGSRAAQRCSLPWIRLGLCVVSRISTGGRAYFVCGAHKMTTGICTKGIRNTIFFGFLHMIMIS